MIGLYSFGAYCAIICSHELIATYRFADRAKKNAIKCSNFSRIARDFYPKSEQKAAIYKNCYENHELLSL